MNLKLVSIVIFLMTSSVLGLEYESEGDKLVTRLKDHFEACKSGPIPQKWYKSGKYTKACDKYKNIDFLYDHKAFEEFIVTKNFAYILKETYSDEAFVLHVVQFFRDQAYLLHYLETVEDLDFYCNKYKTVVCNNKKLKDRLKRYNQKKLMKKN